MRKFFTYVFVFALSFQIWQQNIFAQSSNKIHLTSGTFETVQNVLSVKSLKPSANDFSNGYYYRIVQFENTVSDQKRQQLEQKGISIFGYLPENAFLAGIPFNFDLNDWQKLGVWAVIPLTEKHKLDTRIAKQDWPDWALRPNNQIALTVRYFNNLPQQIIVKKIQDAGFIINEIDNYTSTIVVSVGVDKINTLAAMPEVWYVEAIQHPGDPENLPGVTNHRSNFINGNYTGAPKYDGAGVIVAMGDDGIIGPHIDYTGRVNQQAVSTNNGSHGDHVAGIIFGAGNLNPIARGMAPGATLYVYQVWNAVNQSPITYNDPGVRITSTSYGDGCNAGYTTFAQTADRHIHENKSLLHVFSAGNSGTSSCNYGAGAGWGNITGGVKVGKNTIAVANVTITDGLAASSSRGPAHDGRIKPDISAVGTNVFSTIDENTYASNTGTSMAAPAISGILAQLYQAYKAINNHEPHAGLAKSVLLNTADDLGNPGPDYSFGFGRVNAKNALKTIEENWYHQDSITSFQTKTHTVSIPAGTKKARIMLYWVDKEAVPNAATALVNNLDLKVINSNVRPNPFLPLVLDPTPIAANLNLPAIEGIDSLNNVEQVTITDPIAGNYTVEINANRVVFGPQTYQIVWFFETDSITLTYPVGGEGLVPGVAEQIRWDVAEATAPFFIELSTDSGLTWSRLGIAPPALRVLNFTPTQNQVTDKALVRVSSGNRSSQSISTFSIVDAPNNLTIAFNCPDSLGLIWDSVPGAIGYEISRLGTIYMDSIAYSSVNSVTIAGINPTQEDWFAATAVMPNGAKGRRSVAVRKLANNISCVLDYDIALNKITSPSAVSVLCGGATATAVSVELFNSGILVQSQTEVSYIFNNQTFTDTINTPPAGAGVVHTFSQFLTNLLPGNYNIIVFSTMIGDQNKYNDTLELSFEVRNGTIVGNGYSELFESQTLCSVNTTCEAVACDLTNGWINVPNGQGDDIDWRVHRGTTATNNTGPQRDFLPGSAAGKYIYLESTTCFGKEAQLVSPCMDLSNMANPEFKFAYHMFGNSMGSLHLDVYHNNTWIVDFMTPISGNQSNQWFERIVSLNSFINDTIQIRFRGITGNNFTSDMALDAFFLIDNVSPPIANFTSAKSIGCVNTQFQFSDNSINGPTSWLWQINPASYTFVGGTDSISQFPIVSFSQTGNYTITLIATNSFGSDTLISANLITITGGQSLPVTENFETLPFPTQGWEVNNQGSIFGWGFANVSADIAGRATSAIRANNFQNNQPGTESYFTTPPISGSGINSLYVVFDVAYAMYQNTADSLLVQISTDCGETWQNTNYYKGGNDLATTNARNSAYTPTAANQWRREFLDISSFTGTTIQLRFVNKNMYGNNLFIDNIHIDSNVVPTALFTTSQRLCAGLPVTFTNNSSLALSNYFSFGFDANPSFATGFGNASVTFQTSGAKQVWLAVANPYGTDTLFMNLTIDSIPISDFSFTVTQPLTVDFQYTGNQANVIDWNFGDGNTASGNFQNHVYANPGIYQVTATAINSCGSNSITKTIDLLRTSVPNLSSDSKWKLFPNPTKGDIQLVGEEIMEGSYVWELTDLQGRLIATENWIITGKNATKVIQLNNLQDGVYIGSLKNTYNSATFRIVVTK